MFDIKYWFIFSFVSCLHVVTVTGFCGSIVFDIFWLRTIIIKLRWGMNFVSYRFFLWRKAILHTCVEAFKGLPVISCNCDCNLLSQVGRLIAIQKYMIMYMIARRRQWRLSLLVSHSKTGFAAHFGHWVFRFL